MTNELWRWDHYNNEWAYLSGNTSSTPTQIPPVADATIWRSGKLYYVYVGENSNFEILNNVWELNISDETLPTTGTIGTTGTTGSTGTTSTGTTGSTGSTGTTGTTGAISTGSPTLMTTTKAKSTAVLGSSSSYNFLVLIFLLLVIV